VRGPQQSGAVSPVALLEDVGRSESRSFDDLLLQGAVDVKIRFHSLLLKRINAELLLRVEREVPVLVVVVGGDLEQGTRI